MPSHLADREIGHRAYEEFNRVLVDSGLGVYNFCRRAGFSYHNQDSWRLGMTPSTYNLQKLDLVGADIYYIVTGKRKNNS